MTYFIIGFIVFMLWGSVLWIKPSPRDKQLVRLRRKAIRSGLTIKIVDQSLRKHVKKLDAVEAAISAYWFMYDLHLLFNRKSPQLISLDPVKCEAALKNYFPRIDFVSERRVFLEKLNLLPENEGLLISSFGIAFVWRELGNEKNIEFIAAFLDWVIQAATKR